MNGSDDGKEPIVTVIDALREQAKVELLNGRTDLALKVMQAEGDAVARDLERFRATQDAARLDFERFRMMFESVISYGGLAIKALLLLNGGAALALLALIGHLAAAAQSSAQPLIFGLSGPILSFGWGAFVAAAAAGGAYLSQYFYQYHSDDKWLQAGVAIHVLTVASVLGGYGLFLWGLYHSVNAFAIVPST
jgi:hypothetical protein